MTAISQYGVLGAFCGLLFGVIDFAILNRLLYPRLRDSYEFAKTEQRQGVSPAVIMNIIKLSCFTVFPVIGYLIGQEMFGAQGF